MTESPWLDKPSQLPAELIEALRHAPGEPSPVELQTLAQSLGASLGTPILKAPPRLSLVKDVGIGAKPLGTVVAAWVVGGAMLGAGLVGVAHLEATSVGPAPSRAVVATSAVPAALELAPQPVLPAVSSEPEAPVAPTAAGRPMDHAAAAALARSSFAGTKGQAVGETEVQLLKRAQQALAADPVRALALVAEHRRRFPGALLEQERGVIEIAALLQLGRKVEASARADEFRARYPGSAHTRRVNALFGELER
ncbi:MAG TPA: hypothetical protein VHB79_39195 [Polyangiaceae bacterium]|nr:hypothetical protein [Polyangiaceae bacterium]